MEGSGLPLALAISSGSEILQPLAVAVIGNLAFALLLSLVVTPTVYDILRKHRVRARIDSVQKPATLCSTRDYRPTTLHNSDTSGLVRTCADR